MARTYHPCRLHQQERDQHAERPACKIDPVVIQPFPAAEVNCLGAARVKGMLLRFLLIGGTVVHSLYRCTQEGVEE